jgi:hypothetical protein
VFANQNSRRPPIFGFLGTCPDHVGEVPTGSESTSLSPAAHHPPLFPLSPCILASLPPYLLFDRHCDEKLLSISSLFATLTSTTQIAENTSTLSPFLATHTDFAPVSPVFATHTKTPGVVVSLTKIFSEKFEVLTKNSNLCLNFVLPSRSFCSLFSLFAQRVFYNSFVLKRFRTLSKNSRVYPNSSHSGIHCSRSATILVLSFHALTNAPSRNSFILTFMQIGGGCGGYDCGVSKVLLEVALYLYIKEEHAGRH